MLDREDPGLLRGHVAMTCECMREFCVFCRFRLLACTRCGALGTVWPDDCPGRPLDVREVVEIYNGRLNFRDGTWHGEPSQVMTLMQTRGRGDGPRSTMRDLSVHHR